MARPWLLQREGWAEENPRHSLLLACQPSLLLLAKSSRWGVNDRLSQRSHLASSCTDPASPQLLQQCTNEQVRWNSAFCRKHEGLCAADTCKGSSSYHSPKRSQLRLRYCPRGLSCALGLCQPFPSIISAGLGPGRNAACALPEVLGLFPGTFIIRENPQLEPLSCSLETSNWWKKRRAALQQSPSAELAPNPGPVSTSQVLDEALKICNYIFTVIFVLESVFKLIAFGFRRFFQDR